MKEILSIFAGILAVSAIPALLAYIAASFPSPLIAAFWFGLTSFIVISIVFFLIFITIVMIERGK